MYVGYVQCKRVASTSKWAAVCLPFHFTLKIQMGLNSTILWFWGMLQNIGQEGFSLSIKHYKLTWTPMYKVRWAWKQQTTRHSEVDLLLMSTLLKTLKLVFSWSYKPQHSTDMKVEDWSTFKFTHWLNRKTNATCAGNTNSTNFQHEHKDWLM